MKQLITHKGTIIQDPPLAQTLFSDTRMSWLWLILRVWLGYKWVDAALHKLDNPAWVQTGAALKGFWTGAVVVPKTGRPAIAFEWYCNFIQYLLDAEAYVWFGKLVVYDELLVGIALILAWKVANFIGLDYFALPFIGTPWRTQEPKPDLALT